MANPERGEVDLAVHPDDPNSATLTLFMSTNAVCELQKRTGKTYGQVLRSMDDLDYESFREVFWAALKKHHGRQFPNIEKVGDLIDEAKRYRVQKALFELFTLNLPPKEEDADQNGNGRPPGAADGADGTGGSSISTSAPTA